MAFFYARLAAKPGDFSFDNRFAERIAGQFLGQQAYFPTQVPMQFTFGNVIVPEIAYLGDKDTRTGRSFGFCSRCRL
jgi:hypothetical protein